MRWNIMSSIRNKIGQQFNNTLGQTVAFGQQLGQSINTAANEIKIGDHTVVVKEQLAEGGFGVIDLVADVITKKEYVLKHCNIDRNEIFEIVRREINVLEKFAGQYIVQLIATDIIQKNRTSREALLLLEYYPGGHLMERLQKRQGNLLPVESILRIFGQVSTGLLAFHNSKPPIIHRDLKLENILFGLDGKVRLCDFGSCLESPIYIRTSDERQRAEESIAKETTQMYRSPEMIDLYMRSELTTKTDIWAMGCILYALCYLTHPFPDGSSLAILNAKLNFPTDHRAQHIPNDINDLILRMLDIDPECRPDIGEVLECCVALANSRPLPDQNLSEEALQKRKDRIAANEVRQNRSNMRWKKSPPAPSGPKVAVKVNSNSVAAKRLAAKKGLKSGSNNSTQQSVGEVSTTSSVPVDDSFAAFNNEANDVTFDDFNTANQMLGFSTSADNGANEYQNQNDTLLFSDDFGQNLVESANVSSTEGFDAFHDSVVNDPHSPNSPIVDAFESSNTYGGNNLFEDPPQEGFSTNNAQEFDSFNDVAGSDDGFGTTFDATAPVFNYDFGNESSTDKRFDAFGTPLKADEQKINGIASGFDAFEGEQTNATHEYSTSNELDEFQQSIKHASNDAGTAFDPFAESEISNIPGRGDEDDFATKPLPAKSAASALFADANDFIDAGPDTTNSTAMDGPFNASLSSTQQVDKAPNSFPRIDKDDSIIQSPSVARTMPSKTEGTHPSQIFRDTSRSTYNGIFEDSSVPHTSGEYSPGNPFPNEITRESSTYNIFEANNEVTENSGIASSNNSDPFGFSAFDEQPGHVEQATTNPFAASVDLLGDNADSFNISSDIYQKPPKPAKPGSFTGRAVDSNSVLDLYNQPLQPQKLNPQQQNAMLGNSPATVQSFPSLLLPQAPSPSQPGVPMGGMGGYSPTVPVASYSPSMGYGPGIPQGPRPGMMNGMYGTSAPVHYTQQMPPQLTQAYGHQSFIHTSMGAPPARDPADPFASIDTFGKR